MTQSRKVLMANSWQQGVRQYGIYHSAATLYLEELVPTNLAKMAHIFDESAAAAIINYAEHG